MAEWRVNHDLHDWRDTIRISVRSDLLRYEMSVDISSSFQHQAVPDSACRQRMVEAYLQHWVEFINSLELGVRSNAIADYVALTFWRALENTFQRDIDMIIHGDRGIIAPLIPTIGGWDEYNDRPAIPGPLMQQRNLSEHERRWLSEGRQPRPHEIEQRRKKEADRRNAETKARALLIKLLSPEQKTQFEQHGYVDVTVKPCSMTDSFGHRIVFDSAVFRIHPQRTNNVERMSDGTKFCAGPTGDMPIYDFMAAQKVMLESEPEKFFEKAKITPLHRVTINDMNSIDPMFDFEHIPSILNTFRVPRY